MLLRAVYLSIFLAGLALAVHAMLHGAERWRRRRSAKPSALLNPPTVAAMAVGLGACGYLLTTRTDLSPFAGFIISLATALGAFFGMTVLMAKWALRPTSPSAPREEDDINGQIAIVSKTIMPLEGGEITWSAWGSTHMLPAHSLDESEIPEGTEVVIDLVTDGIARVELWSVVEQRL